MMMFQYDFHLFPSLTDIDHEEALKIQREREALLENIKLPSLDVILRAPIEVWVSSSKTFVSPDGEQLYLHFCVDIHIDEMKYYSIFKTL